MVPRSLLWLVSPPRLAVVSAQYPGQLVTLPPSQHQKDLHSVCPCLPLLAEGPSATGKGTVAL